MPSPRPGFSTLRTSAPRSPSSDVHHGPAAWCERSMTRMPASAARRSVMPRLLPASASPRPRALTLRARPCLAGCMAAHFELPADHPHVAVVTIDRPAQANALDPPTLRDLAAAWRAVAADPEIRCAVLTGAGDRPPAAADPMGARARAPADGPSDRRAARTRDRPREPDRPPRAAHGDGARYGRRDRRQRAARGARDAAGRARDRAPLARRGLQAPGGDRRAAPSQRGRARGAAGVRREATAGVEGAVTSPTAAPVLTELYGAPTAASAAMSHPVLWHFTFAA